MHYNNTIIIMLTMSFKIKLFINLSTFRRPQYIIKYMFIEEAKIKSLYELILYFYNITFPSGLSS